MFKLTELIKESIEQHKRKVYLKAVIDMATAYSRRGYTQDEAIKDAAQGVKNVYGYELTPQDIEAIRHFVPVNPQFKEEEDFDVSDNPLGDSLRLKRKGVKTIERIVQDVIQNLKEELKGLNADAYCIYDVTSSRGLQDGTTVSTDTDKETVIEYIESEIREILEEQLEDALADGDEEEAEGVINYMDEFVGNVYFEENTHRDDPFSSIEVSIGEESFIAIVNADDAEKAEEEYGIYE